MIIRRCEQSDIASVGQFYDKVVRYLDEHINYPKWQYKQYPSESSVRAETDNGSQYIVEEDGEMIGAFVFNDDPQGDYSKGKWECDLPSGAFMVIHGLAIDPEWHGKGIGTRVLEYCINNARERGFKAIRLDIVPDNTPAAHLYEKMGFTYAGTEDLGRGIEGIPEFSLYELNF